MLSLIQFFCSMELTVRITSEYTFKSMEKKMLRVLSLPLIALIIFFMVTPHRILLAEEKNTARQIISMESKKTEMSEKGMLWGRLVDEAGKPIAGVDIRVLGEFITDGKAVRSTSDNEGKFSINVGNRGIIEMTLTSKGFAAKEWTTDKRGDIGDIVLKKGFNPKVRLLSPDGKPVPHVYLVIRKANNTSIWSGVSERPTDDEGYSVLPPIEEGEYYVDVFRYRNEDVLRKLPFVIVGKPFSFSQDQSQVELTANKAVSVTMRFEDGIDIPDKNDWVVFQAFPINNSSWFIRSRDAISCGDGVYTFERIPRNVPLRLMVFRDDDTVFGCQISRGNDDDDDDTEMPIPGYLDIGQLDRDTVINIVCHKSPIVTLHAIDKEGKSINEFYAVGVYSDLSSDSDGKPFYDIEKTQDGFRIKPDELKNNFIDWRNLISYNFNRSFKIKSQVNYLWDHENKKGRVLSILPNQQLILILYDVKGRQGSVDLKLKDGQKIDLTVTLKE